MSGRLSRLHALPPSLVVVAFFKLRYKVFKLLLLTIYFLMPLLIFVQVVHWPKKLIKDNY